MQKTSESCWKVTHLQKSRVHLLVPGEQSYGFFFISPSPVLTIKKNLPQNPAEKDYKKSRIPHPRVQGTDKTGKIRLNSQQVHLSSWTIEQLMFNFQTKLELILPTVMLWSVSFKCSFARVLVSCVAMLVRWSFKRLGLGEMNRSLWALLPGRIKFS